MIKLVTRNLRTRLTGFRLARSCSTVNENHLKQSIVNAAILHIKTEGRSLSTGFSQTAISRGCEDLDLSPASARLLDNGPIALINFLNIHWNENFKLDVQNDIRPE